jgi:ribosomal protein L37AE/L43A
MFVHPSFAILIVWTGLVIAGVWAVVEARIRKRERREIRDAITEGVCPRCGHAVQRTSMESPTWKCDSCSGEFADNGEIMAPTHD